MNLKDGKSNSQICLSTLARTLGQDTFEKTKEQANRAIAHETLRRNKFNLAEIASLKGQYDSLFRCRAEHLETIRLSPSNDPRHLLHRRCYYRLFALTLILAGIFFAHLALAPFGLGWEAWVLCLGIGGVAAFWTEQTLEKIDCEPLLQCICVLALLASLGGLLVMAILRGDILALYVKSTVETMADSPESGTAFYGQAIWKIQLLMGLLTVAVELGSGVAMFEANKLDLAGYERATRARRALAEVEAQMGDIIGRVTHLENDAAMNEDEFWRNFYLGMLERIKSNAVLPLFLLALLSGWGSTAWGEANHHASPTAIQDNIVIALDLTQSVSSRGYDGKTDFEKNVDAACKLITQLPPGAKFTVLAITDRSFAQPYILLQKTLPEDKGPLQFQDRIALAKTRAASELQRLASSSEHSIPHTDVFGALILAADILGRSAGRKTLVVFSDMRQSTSELDLERSNTGPNGSALSVVEKLGLIAKLQNVDVYVVGVDGAGKSIPYWNGLRTFWESYFQNGGANLRRYSAVRELPFLGGDER
jgi:hypothetical protein